jgi:hypothetical protein
VINIKSLKPPVSLRGKRKEAEFDLTSSTTTVNAAAGKKLKFCSACREKGILNSEHKNGSKCPYYGADKDEQPPQKNCRQNTALQPSCEYIQQQSTFSQPQYTPSQPYSQITIPQQHHFPDQHIPQQQFTKPHPHYTLSQSQISHSQQRSEITNHQHQITQSLPQIFNFQAPFTQSIPQIRETVSYSTLQSQCNASNLNYSHTQQIYVRNPNLLGNSTLQVHNNNIP